MGQRITNIPKSTILYMAMGNTEYKVSNKKKSFAEPRIKVRYHSTADRLTRAQILVLLEMHKHLDSKGYAYEVRIRTLAEATHLTMQCVNQCIQTIEEKHLIVIGIKEYGYLNYFIDLEKGYLKEGNTGGYYPMDNALLDDLLNIKHIDKLRFVLICLIEDDFSRMLKQKTVIRYESLKKIMPSSAHPKARREVLKAKTDEPYTFTDKNEGIHFKLNDIYYGKLTSARIKVEAEQLLIRLKTKQLSFNKKDSNDIISLCQEFGTDSINNVLYAMEPETLKGIAPIGAYLRKSIQTA